MGRIKEFYHDLICEMSRTDASLDDDYLYRIHLENEKAQKAWEEETKLHKQ